MKKFVVDNANLKSFAYEILIKMQGQNTPVFLCVGSDKFIMDSLGPIVGELLVKKYNIGAYVYGGLSYNINANNLSSALAYIETEHPYSPIIVVDATFGDEIGMVGMCEGCYAGLGKILPVKKLGDFSILGVVGNAQSKFDLNTIKLKVVCDMSNFIAKAIAMAMSVYMQSKSIRKKNLSCIES